MGEFVAAAVDPVSMGQPFHSTSTSEVVYIKDDSPIARIRDLIRVILGIIFAVIGAVIGLFSTALRWLLSNPAARILLPESSP